MIKIELHTLLKSPVTASITALASLLISIGAIYYNSEASTPNIRIDENIGASNHNKFGTIDGLSSTETNFSITIRNTGGRATSIDEFELVKINSHYVKSNGEIIQTNPPKPYVYCINPIEDNYTSMFGPHKTEMKFGIKCDFRKRIDAGETVDYNFLVSYIDTPTTNKLMSKLEILFHLSDGSTKTIKITIDTPSPNYLISTKHNIN